MARLPRKQADANAPGWQRDPQYLAFEQDIIEHPDDDAPRLILADWLDEHGDEHTSARAEFIRVQIESDRLPRHDPRRNGLDLRQQQLLAVHEPVWLGKLAGIVTEAEWQRGFVQRVKLGVRVFMDNADELFRQAPVLHLQLLRISQTKMSMEDLASSPHFARLRGLSLPMSSIGDDKLAVLLGKANLERLEVLELRGAAVGPLTLEAIAKGTLPRLRKLDLSGNWIPGHLPALCQARVPFSLKELDLSSTELSPACREALFAWPGLSELESLDLRNVRLGTTGGALLAKCPHLKRLRSLFLNNCAIGIRGTQALGESSLFPALEELSLTNNAIRPRGLVALLANSLGHRLTSLLLAGNGLGDAGVDCLAGWQGLSRHQTLDLGGNEITAAGVRTLCSSPHLGQLTSLDLNVNSIGDEGAQILASCPRMASLRHLSLAQCDIDEQGMIALLDSEHLTNLQSFNVFGNFFRKQTAQRLLDRFPDMAPY